MISKFQLPSNLSEDEGIQSALDHLKDNHPEDFQDEDQMEMSYHIIVSLKDEIRSMNALEAVSMIASVKSLMWQFSGATSRYINGSEKPKDIVQIFNSKRREESA